jgi:hypothetical protein
MTPRASVSAQSCSQFGQFQDVFLHQTAFEQLTGHLTGLTFLDHLE